MANFTKSISNNLVTFGGRADLWGAYNWGAFQWGEGTADLPVDVMHFISRDSLSSDSSVPNRDFTHVISESMSPTSLMDSEELLDGSGYDYVFPSNETNHQNESLASYTSGTSPSNTWTSHAAGSTPWS